MEKTSNCETIFVAVFSHSSSVISTICLRGRRRMQRSTRLVASARWWNWKFIFFSLRHNRSSELDCIVRSFFRNANDALWVCIQINLLWMMSGHRIGGERDNERFCQRDFNLGWSHCPLQLKHGEEYQSFRVRKHLRSQIFLVHGSIPRIEFSIDNFESF